MKIIRASVEQMSPYINQTEFLQTIERAGRICYKSEDKITDDSAVAFVRKLIKNGHEAMIEHAPNISMLFVTDRGVSHEIVRHRLFSFAQESTRYCNYSGGHLTVIKPCWFKDDYIYGRDANGDDCDTYTTLDLLSDEAREKYSFEELLWLRSCLNDETTYHTLTIECGWPAQYARSVLPNSTKTEIIVSGNIREWRHFFKLRLAKTAHPQMREVASLAFDILNKQIPVMFEDLKNGSVSPNDVREQHGTNYIARAIEDGERSIP